MEGLVNLSAALIVYNEEEHIAEALKQLDFADEIIVVDSFSTDRTVDIISSFSNVTLVQHPFKDFASQRNFAITLLKGSWVLFIDADERIPEPLKNEILKTITAPDAKAAYKFKRKFMFEGKHLRYSGYQTDSVHRLFKKGYAFYKPQRLVHEKLTINGETATLNHKLLHYSYKSYDHYKAKMISYGKLKGLEVFKRNLKPNVFHKYVKPAYKFINHYIIRLGFLDGKKGLDISYLNALSIAERYREADRLFRSSPKE